MNEDSNDVSVITPTSTGNTPVGTNVSVTPVPSVTITFAQVTAAGDTLAAMVGNPPTFPDGFQADGMVFDITTTASFVAPITVCLPFSPGDPNPAIYHYENVPFPQWVDKTTSVDNVNHIVCGTVSSLSPFAVLTPVVPTPTPTPTPPTPTPTPTPTPPPVQAEIQALITLIDNSHIAPVGIKLSLKAKLNDALRALEADNSFRACCDIEEFSIEVRVLRFRHIPPQAADALIDGGLQIRQQLGCGGRT